MNLQTKPSREIGEPLKDYRPPQHRLIETESEVMPTDQGRFDDPEISSEIRPARATPANRLSDIADLIGALTYGEMIDLAAAIWNARPEGKELNSETLAPTLHAWSGKEKP